MKDVRDGKSLVAWLRTERGKAEAANMRKRVERIINAYRLPGSWPPVVRALDLRWEWFHGWDLANDSFWRGALFMGILTGLEVQDDFLPEEVDER